MSPVEIHLALNHVPVVALPIGLVSLGPNLFLTGFGIPAPNQLKDVIAFTVLVLVLIFRPNGIFGRKEEG